CREAIHHEHGTFFLERAVLIRVFAIPLWFLRNVDRVQLVAMVDRSALDTCRLRFRPGLVSHNQIRERASESRVRHADTIVYRRNNPSARILKLGRSDGCQKHKRPRGRSGPAASRLRVMPPVPPAAELVSQMTKEGGALRRLARHRSDERQNKI